MFTNNLLYKQGQNSKKKKISNSCQKYAAKTKILYSTRYTPILKSIKTMTLIFLIS